LTTTVAGGSLTDVAGLRVGHHHRIGRGWLTGTTVILALDGAVGGVDVRGGGPGTRETDLLDPRNVVDTVQAVMLSGGSAFGLAAATGVMRWLEERRVGFPVGDGPGDVVPIVPGAVLFDLGRGGRFVNRPDETFGFLAAAKAGGRTGTGPVGEGTVGAGTGARAGGLKGGIGTASTRLSDGTTVGALAAVNAAGRVLDPSTGLPWAVGVAQAGELGPLPRPSRALRRLAADLPTAPPPLNTTIGVIATDARLTKAECQRMAGSAHDGLALAVRPAHSMFDGDTVFALATGTRELEVAEITASFRGAASRAGQLNHLLAAAAMCFARAVTRAVVKATSAGGLVSYRDAAASVGAFTARDTAPRRRPR
jgi:putative pantetheine hydrolase